MKSQAVPWSEKCVFICTKCHQSFSEQDLQQEGNCGENLKNFLKQEIKKQGRSQQARVMTSSCLNICQPKTQAVLIQKNSAPAEIVTVHPETDRDILLKYLVTDLRKAEE